MLKRLAQNELIYNVAISAFVIVGTVLLVGNRGWWPSYYAPQFFGIAFILSALIILASRKVFYSANSTLVESGNFLRFVIMFALVINAAGELFFYQLYKYGFQFDKLAHLVNSLLFTLALIPFAQTWLKYSYNKSLKATIITVTICAFGWELTEYTSDLLFHTKSFGIYGQVKLADTISDIIFNFMGVILALIYQKINFHKISSVTK